MNMPLPAKCFISHSYADTAARERLLRILPDSVMPLVFPPIQARPDEFVSKPLIEAILTATVSFTFESIRQVVLGSV